jgi:hypothetical protein
MDEETEMNDQPSQPPTDLSPDSNKPASPAIISPAAADPNRSIWISKCARVILSSYRRDDFADPDGFLVQAAMVLERYPDEIIRQVTSPITGIQRTCKWPPSIAELVEFCDDAQRRATFTARWDEQTRKQLAERKEFERSAKAESAEHRAAVVQRVWGTRAL